MNGKYLSKTVANRRFVRGNSVILPSGKPVNGVLIFDIDSTVADTKPWFADIILPLIEKLAAKFGCPAPRIHQLFAKLAMETSLHEYGYVVERIADECPDLALSAELVSEAAAEFWKGFSVAHYSIQPYPALVETLKRLRKNCPGMAIVALTDAPDFLAPARLAHIGALPYFDGIVAIESRRPDLKNQAYVVCELESRHRMETMQLGYCENLVMQASLPFEHAKPSDVGIGFIIEWLGLDADQVVICGDKETKEGLAATNWHIANPEAPGHITYLRAFYGVRDVMEKKFVELGKKIPTMAPKAPADDHGIHIDADLHTFADIIPHIEGKFGRRKESKFAA